MSIPELLALGLGLSAEAVASSAASLFSPQHPWSHALKDSLTALRMLFTGIPLQVDGGG